MEVRLPFFPKRGYVSLFLKNLKQPTAITYFHLLMILMMQDKIKAGYLPIFCNHPIRLLNNFIVSSMDSYEYQPSAAAPNQFFNTTNSFNKSKLWKDSETTIKYVSPLLSFSKEKRFKWSSIYWPENNNQNNFFSARKGKSEVHEAAKKISKLIDQEQKNQQRIKQIKRTLSIGKSQLGSTKKQSHVVLSTKKPFKLSKETERIVMKLAPLSVRKQSLLRDRHGNRCNMFDNPEQQNQKTLPQFFGDSTGFKTSRKIRLELPHNYYPGPGTYDIKRYLAQLDQKSKGISNQLNETK